MNLNENTSRKGIYVKYYFAQKAGKTQITAQLTDQFGAPIKNARASFTQPQPGKEKEAKIVARNRALEKLDKSLGIGSSKEDTTNKMDYFTPRWYALSPDERRALVAQTHERDNSRDSIIKYFENNVLSILDQYGPSITPDQCKALANELYHNMLKAKKYTEFFTESNDVKLIPSFLELVVTEIVNDKQINKLFAQKRAKDQVESIFCELKDAILAEDRLRSLLESYLMQADIKHTSILLIKKMKVDLELISQLSNTADDQTRKVAMDKTIFLIRELSGNEIAIKCQTNVHIRDINAILNNWCTISNLEIPAIIIPEYDVERSMQIELCKELPWVVRTRYAAMIMHIADTSWYGCGGIIMMTSGPRVSEVCAIQFGDVVDAGDWGICVINYTTDGNIRRTDGKNIYYHRPIFFPKYAMDALHARKNYLITQGLDAESIMRSYIVCRSDNPMQPASPNAFASEIKKILQFAGCDDQYWATVQQAMYQQPDLDYFRRPEKFDVAYCLRRDATSCMCNIAKMDSFVVDAILGHHLPRYVERWDRWITREDNWLEIIQQIERIVYDPAHSAHPLFSPIALVQGRKDLLPQVPYPSFSLTTYKAARIKITIRTIGNSNVVYTLPQGRGEYSEMIHIVNTDGPYRSLPATHSWEEYMIIIKKALEDFVKKPINDLELES